MMNFFKKIVKLVSSLLIAAVVLLAILLAGVRVFGFQVYTVLSPSMEPVYPTGSLIYVKDVDPAELDVNDVITFKLSSGATATHRIIELVPSEDEPGTIRFRTKGDANEISDGSLVRFDAVIGSPVASIPYLGYFATYIQSPPGLYVTIFLSLILLLLVVLSDSIPDKKQQNKIQK